MDAIVARAAIFRWITHAVLDSLVDDVRAVTGRLYGATNYVRPLCNLSAGRVMPLGRHWGEMILARWVN